MVRIVACLAGLMLAASFAGAFHPIGDSLAVLRLPFAVVFALAVIWTNWSAATRWSLAALAMVPLVLVVWDKSTSPAPGSFTVYQKNMLYRNTALDDLYADIEARAPDVITLQEVSSRNETLLAKLAAEYPYQHLCRYRGWRGVAVLSRSPFAPDSAALCEPAFGMAVALVQSSDGPVWVASVHMHWPFPYEQAAQRDALQPLLRGLEGPLILSGDFNMVPWGASVRDLGSVAGEKAGPLRPTYRLKGVPLPIDHIFAPGGGRVEVLPLLGSDHNGLFGRVSIKP